MTDIRARGFESPAQLREYLGDLDQDASETLKAPEIVGRDTSAEVEMLRREVAELRRRISSLRDHTDDLPEEVEPDRPWLRIAATVAATVILGRLARRLRLGTSGAAAVPLIASQIGNRF